MERGKSYQELILEKEFSADSVRDCFSLISIFSQIEMNMLKMPDYYIRPNEDANYAEERQKTRETIKKSINDLVAEIKQILSKYNIEFKNNLNYL